jgi:arsenate reductase
VTAAILPILVLAGYAAFVWWLWREVGAPPARRRAAATQAERPRERQERVLFVCTHNSARSQMAEALLRHVAGSRFLVASAGTAPAQIHPLAEQVMAERGLSLRSHWPKALGEVGTRWDYVVTVCDAANERCPEFEAKTSRLHWSIDDPSREEGRYAEQLEAFRRVRDELGEQIHRWVADRPERP